MKKAAILAVSIMCIFCISLINGYTESIPVDAVNVNNIPIPFLEQDGKVFIKVKDLERYGFDVLHNKENEKIEIRENPNRFMDPIDCELYKMASNNITSSEIMIQLDSHVVNAYRINEEILIDVEELDKLKRINVIDKDINNEHVVCVELRYEHPLERKYIKQHTINIVQKGDRLYCDGEKIGFIRDNVEMLSLTYITKKLGYELYEEGNEDKSIWKKYATDGSYSFSIRVEVDDDEYLAIANWDNAQVYTKELIAKPIEEDGNCFIPLVDLKQFMNLEIIRKDDEKIFSIGNEGSNSGNIINEELMMKSGEWVYYANPKDDNKLYKIHVDGTQNQKVYDYSVDYINVIDNSIYYIKGFLDSEGIYRIDTDGSNEIELLDGEVSFMSVVNETIYYCKGDYGGELYSMNADGTQHTLLSKDKVEFPVIINGWTYYINVYDENTIYRMKTDGSQNTRINSRYADYLNVNKDFICFGSSEELYKIKHDGTYETKVINVDDLRLLVLTDDGLYWIDWNESIYFMDKDGIEKKLIYKGSSLHRIWVEDKEVYFFDDIVERNFYRINIETLEKEVISSTNIEQIRTVTPSHIYYVGDDNKLYRTNKDGTEPIKIEGKEDDEIYKVIGDRIYFWEWDGINGPGLYLVNLEENQKMKVLDSNATRINIEQDGIYFLERKNEDNINLSKINLDGTERVPLIKYIKKDFGIEFKIDEDWIFYTEPKGVYKIKTDGTKRRRLLDETEHIRDIEVKGNYIYYRIKNDLYRINKYGNSKEKIINDLWTLYGIGEDYIYYVKEDRKLYALNLKNEKSEKLSSIQVNSFIACEDNFLYCTVISEDTSQGYYNSLYRIDLETGEEEMILKKVDYGIYLSDDEIFCSEANEEYKFLSK